MDAPDTQSNKPQELAHRHKRFVWEYCKDHIPGQAAIRAGYKERSANHIASALLRKPAIQDAIRERERQIAEAALLDETIVLEGLLREARYTGDGSTHTARVSAWREVAKILGLEIRKVEHTVTHRLDGRLAQARQRAQLIEAQAQALPAPGTALAQPDAVDAEFTEDAPDGGENPGVVQAGGG